jgi:hypothetical protein
MCFFLFFVGFYYRSYSLGDGCVRLISLIDLKRTFLLQTLESLQPYKDCLPFATHIYDLIQGEGPGRDLSSAAPFLPV